MVNVNIVLRYVVTCLLGLQLSCAARLRAPRTTLSLMSRPNPGDDDGGKCPPCFNCMLPIFECKQFSECNSNTGRCECIAGFDGDDCSVPLCGGLDDANERRPKRENGTNTCQCKPGWGGINCNTCEEDFACDAFMPSPELKGTCYKNGMIVNKSYQGCNVTNEKILQVLKGKQPQVTFSCSNRTKECNFQFWIDKIESFYCGLERCRFEYDLHSNISHYTCEDVQCRCLPDTMLCGAHGSIDISDFLKETIKGPGDFVCDLVTRECKFTEPSMNDLISSFFGDPYITLSCRGGECLHYSEIPGYNPPSKDISMSWQAKFILALTSVLVLLLVMFATFCISKSPLFKTGSIQLLPGDDYLSASGGTGTDEDRFDSNFLKSDVEAVLTFNNIDYRVNGRESEKILNGISGMVQPGEIMALLGGSGAGKTTLLDILAMKKKVGQVSGDIRVNGQVVTQKDYVKLIGFVDQDDYLLPTLTVYETVLNSALLRLPRVIPFETKQARVYKVLEELRILEIKDKIIGNEFERGISGGEKRRVSIACELVTSPLILFLDEPTSGLDANNANNVIECLVRLAKTYHRTLVLSIHQPRSNIFQLFDKLVLLSNGEMVYSGDAIRVNEFLRNSGYQCPAEYNIADYLIDITFETQRQSQRRARAASNRDGSDVNPDIFHQTSPSSDLRKNGMHSVLEERNESLPSVTQREWEHFAGHRDEIRTLLKDSVSPEYETVGSVNTKLLHNNFKEGPYYAQLSHDIEVVEANNEGPQVELPSSMKSASFPQQLSILCSRTFKNIYRNPKLLLANYLLTLLLGGFLGTLYYDVSNDISGFQNRLGLFFFIMTYFGFVTLTGLSSFAVERIIFVKERSNNYYSPLAYYLSKIISDVLPLRVIPPIVLGLVVYPLVGLNIAHHGFFKFIGILVLFNLGVSLEILSIGIVFKDLSNSIIVSILVLLASLLFSGLFINTKEITSVAFKYLKNFSLFYYAYESLLINEVKSLMLREKKYGLNIEVPGATILSTFGFAVQNLSLDIKILAASNILFLMIGYIALKLIVVEQK
ncbi:ADP1 (YCR011C) [Zygosaccharomyces parabailii]|uniref:ZYBA0S06-01948g1_1 n=1 Tax=Zygosaccharomyces bailii (strain CLIB 213 / ATCC 58445 / CBS 680 / BCRC 21525 / NBRC 1098 / NCYC 1416 / NRRL Y-2227) TaxID=1333698 RepID=A0A8J2T9X6_ZYGB2|nr:ADP1 (YCR011C) [Zygosaccharomyces parabailii]CDF90156.1 ZYBA0S06-01948g1_1 [Zygosaccharomyces bailii CLIB 213]